MYDIMTTSAMADELRESVLDGRIQKLGMVDELTIAAEVYANGRRQALVASADSSQARLYRASSLPSFDTSIVTPFSLQMRKYVRGGFVIDIEQPPLERVVQFTIARRLPDESRRQKVEVEDEELDESPEGGDIWGRPDVIRVKLIVEIMGRHSNLILVGEDGLVMESAKRVTPSMSRVRPILPKQRYTLPPPLDKPDPRRLTGPGVELMLSNAKESDKLHQVLVRGLSGVSPQMAREYAFNLGGNVNATVGEVADVDHQDIAREVRRLFEPMMLGGWQPRVYERDGVVTGYAALPMRHLVDNAEERSVDTVSEAVEASLEGAGQDAPKDHDQLRSRLLGQIDDARERLAHRLHALREQQRKAEEADKLRHAGETIYAWLWMIEPGQTVLEAEGEEPIPLDPSLDGNGNAQGYFERYRRAQRGLEQVPSRIKAVLAEDRYVEQLRTQVEQSQGFSSLEGLTQEFTEYQEQSGNTARPQGSKGKPAKKRSKSSKGSAPDSYQSAKGHTIHIGRSGKQNDQVTFSIAGPDDTWLHARGVPGSHVIVRWHQPTEEDDPETIETAAALAGWYSSARQGGSAEIDVARRRHVRKISGGGPGMVTYRNEYTIAVQPENEETLRESGKLG